MSLILAIVDLLKGIAWPSAAIFIAAMFRSELKNMFPRIRRASLSGIELDAAEVSAELQSAGVSEAKFTGTFVSTAAVDSVRSLASFQAATRRHLATMAEDHRIDFLVRELAEHQLALRFERIFYRIFGSQILALRALMQSGRVPEQEFRAPFEIAKLANPEFYNDYGFGGWRNFLLATDLISLDDGDYEITDYGRDFIEFIDRNYSKQEKNL